MTVLSFLMGDDLDNIDPFSIAFFVFLVPYGVVSIMFGRRLLKVDSHYRGFTLFCWMSIIAGICFASVALFLLAIPFSLIADIALALIFFEAARELRELS
jgi:hypothetical protein